MTKLQAHKAMISGNDVVLTMKYWDNVQTRTFKSDHFGCETRKNAFYHIIKNEKIDFAGTCTYYRGSKSDCRFSFSIA